MVQGRRLQRRMGALLALGMALPLSAWAAAGPAGAATANQVLRVGTWHGVPGNEPTLEAAVAALRPGGFLLIGPGDWHPRMDYQPAQVGVRYPSALLITASGVHVRGMDRNRVILDGTRPGTTHACSSAPSDQDFGPKVKGVPQGRNGPEALKTDGVYFENFTACNFLTGSADTGNEIWWNGGDDTGKVGLGSWWGNYLTGSSTFFDAAHPGTAAQYGIFVSNSRGPGQVDHAYASNMNDSSFYIGACPDCNGVLNHVHAQNSALGLSSTNAGGHLIIENSEWDHNKTGMVNNSQNSADPPSPQLGTCPGGAQGPYGTTSCTVWRNNYVHDNNNPNVPFQGTAGFGPTGTGMVLAGTRNDTLIGNRIERNGAWGVLTTFFPDTSPGNENNTTNCQGGVINGAPPTLGGTASPCLFAAFSNHIVNNTFSGNGFFGNVTNGDIADLTYPPPESPGAGANCYSGNTDPAGLSTSPRLLATVQTDCANPAAYPATYSPAEFAALATQAGCDSAALFSCPTGTPGASYPQTTKVALMAIPTEGTMPDPCAGVPPNPWCQASGSAQAAPAAPTSSVLPRTGLPATVPTFAAVLLAAYAALVVRRRRRRPPV